jgi:hypothetical protein
MSPSVFLALPVHLTIIAAVVTEVSSNEASGTADNGRQVDRQLIKLLDRPSTTASGKVLTINN